MAQIKPHMWSHEVANIVAQKVVPHEGGPKWQGTFFSENFGASKTGQFSVEEKPGSNCFGPDKFGIPAI